MSYGLGSAPGEIVTIMLPLWLKEDLLKWRDLDAKVTQAGERAEYRRAKELRKERDDVGRRIVIGLVAEVKV